jgi:hypothetical protein
MLNKPTMEKLLALRLNGMTEALKAQKQDPAATELSFHKRLAMMVDQQWNWREIHALAAGKRLQSCAATPALKRSSCCATASPDRIQARGHAGRIRELFHQVASGAVPSGFPPFNRAI